MYRKSDRMDANGIYYLLCKLEKEQFSYQVFQEIYEAQCKDDHYYCLICESEKGIMGFINLRFEKQLHHAGIIAEIMEFIVDEPCRNLGVGTALFDEAARIAYERGCILMEVACNQARTDSHQFYMNHGMKNTHYKFTKVFMRE